MSFDFEKWDQEIEEFDPNNKQRLYEQMKSELKIGDESEVLWRLAKACLILSVGAEKYNDLDLQKKLTEEALTYGKRSCDLDPKNMRCHKWYCAALGRSAKFVGTKQKVKFGKEFKRHADIAIKLNPNDYLMHFMFGRFCYEISSLSWFERKISNALFGSVPKSSFDEALQEFMTTDQLKPEWKDNYLWITKTLIAMKKYSEAKTWIRSGLELTVESMLDEIAHKNLNKLKIQHKL